MKKIQWKSPKGIALIALIAVVAAAAIAVPVWLLLNREPEIIKVPTDEEYVYVNPDESKAETDAGMKIDGILDEEIYQSKKWLHLSNDDGGNNVNIAMTSHFGQQGMYFVFDVTESVPIYVNLDRAPTLNSCIELYLAPSHVKNVQQNTVFEIDLLPTGDMTFKRSNGKYGYENVATTNDIMACLGTTTKGGEVNTEDCYGYALELFIPWSYMEWLDQDVEAMKNGFVLVNPAHITSNNLTGTDHDLDRYWYHYAQKIGVDFTNVAQYFRFNSNGIMGTKEITLTEGEHYSFQGSNIALPGMQIPITIIPEEGYALTSILVDGVEQIHKVNFNEDGSVTLKVRCTGGDQKISAAAEAVTEGNKTLSGKIRLNGGSLQGVLVSYVGPLGEKPVTIDGEGKFELKDLAPGYYELKAEKEGYPFTTRTIYLNRDIYTELTLKASIFTVTGGSSWILDDESEGILYKIKGNGDIISNASYKNFTLETYLRYDTQLAKQGNDDYYLQQRSGVRILFSNGKYWHIDLMRENGQYVLQYGKITGNSSIFNWKNVHTLTAEQAKLYTSANGIKLTVKRVGNQAAIYLGDKALFVEDLAAEYKNYTAKVGFEAWIANDVMMRIPYSLTSGATIPSLPKPYFYAANTWDVTKQQEGIVRKTGVKGVTTWMDAARIANDITTVARDLTPDAKDYSMIYIFKFSNGEQFRVRLNHTDGDGKYRIQSMAGSTLYAAWQNRYTLTDEQAQKAQGDGIAYRVLVHGTTAYVYLDDQQVCTYDLSKVVATGKPSGIEKATVQVSLRLDGIYGKTVDIPFKLVQTNEYVAPQEPEDPDETVPFDPEKLVTVKIEELTNGTVKLGKEQYSIGQTIKLTVTPEAGYTQKLYIDGQPLILPWNTYSYSFVAEKESYEITGSFEKSLALTISDSARWDVANQAHGIISTYYPNNNDSWWLNFTGEYKSVTVKAKNYLPIGETLDNFMVYLMVTMDNGRTYNFRVFTDKGGYYAYNRAGIKNEGDASADWGNWKNLSHLNDAISGDGADFKVERTGDNVLTLSINGEVLDTYTMNGVTAENKIAFVGVKHQGNAGKYIDIAYTLVKPGEEPPAEEEDTVEITIPTFEHGTVTTDKSGYKLGDTVVLTLTPEAGYVQKLYIDGQPLMLGWNTNTYSFTAEKESYEITGEFVTALNSVSGDPGRWNYNNQAHGIISTYYPNDNDSWWTKIQGEYESISINAKNYLPIEESYEGFAGGPWRVMLYMQLDNGKYYAFSMWIDASKQYAYNHYGGNVCGVASATGWGGAWCLISDKNAEAAVALNGDGAAFKLERIDGNHFQITLNGTVLETYTIPEVTEANKVVSVGFQHNGNKGKQIDISYALTKPGQEPPAEEEGTVEITIPTFEHGTVITDKSSYKVGDTVVLTLTPEAGYVQKLYIDGQPLMLGWNTNTYSFTAEKESYEITGSFEEGLALTISDSARWTITNQAHGTLQTYYPNNNDSWWLNFTGEYKSVTVKAKNHLPIEDTKDNFMVYLMVTMDNGRTYNFRVFTDKGGYYAYNRAGIKNEGDASADWGNWKNLSHLNDVISGDGADFKVERTGDNVLTLSVNGEVLDTYTMNGVTAENKIASVGVKHQGNAGKYIDIAYTLVKPGEEPPAEEEDTVEITIPTFEHGTVTTGKSGYKLGDTVVLTLTPEAGYVQKLYIDGQPLLQGWNTNTYSFTAEKESYEITGEFVTALNVVSGDSGRWNYNNQAHGVISTYYPNDNDSWWTKIQGEYKSVSINAKNYLPAADSYEGSANGWRVMLYMQLDNGKYYAFSVWNDTSKRYAYNHYGGNVCSVASATGWGGAWCLISDKNAEAAAALNGDGAAFKLERVDGNHFQITLNGTVLETYTIPDVTEANKVTSVGFQHFGNKGEHIDIAFALE